MGWTRGILPFCEHRVYKYFHRKEVDDMKSKRGDAGRSIEQKQAKNKCGCETGEGGGGGELRTW